MLKYENLILKVLEENEESRENDDVLYFNVVRLINPELILKDFGFVLRNLSSYSIPRYETVTRIRRKLQSERLELRPSKKVQTRRRIHEREVVEYART